MQNPGGVKRESGKAMRKTIKITLFMCLILIVSALALTACDIIGTILPMSTTPSGGEQTTPDNDGQTTPNDDNQNQSFCKHDVPSQIVRVDAVMPTCQQTGLTAGMQCNLCETMVVPQTIVPRLDCDESNWIIDRQTTITKEGLWHTECTMCGKVLRQETSLGTLGLNYVENDGTYMVSISPMVTGETEVIIPATHNGLPVTSIGDYAFHECTGLTSVTVGNNVTNIGYQAFYRCENLTNITFSDSITNIGHQAFCECYSLTSIIIPNNVTNIGNFAFSGCTSLTSIEIPDSVTNIGSSVFYNCTGLTNITLGNGITDIEDFEFKNCSGLVNFVIPASVTRIGLYAFYDCRNLKSLTFEGTTAQWNAIKKDYEWRTRFPATEVICSDGVVKLK